MKVSSQKSFHSILGLLVLFSACTTQTQKTTEVLYRKPSSEIAANSPDQLPKIIKPAPTLETEIEKAIKKSLKGLTPYETNKITTKLKNYLLFLGLNAKDIRRAKRAESLEATTEAEAPRAEGGLVVNDPVAPSPAPVTNGENTGASSVVTDTEAGEEAEDQIPSNLKAVKRLFQGSTQFLFCENFIDWECLEKKPLMKPLAAFRQEYKDEYGIALPAGEKLEIEAYFTQAWDGKTPRSGVAEKLAEKIRSDGTRKLSMAMFGIDDEKESMKSVWDAIQDRASNPEVQVQAVVDVMGVERNPTPWIFDYVPGAFFAPDMLSRWLFGQSSSIPNGMRTSFQYSATPDLIRGLNQKIQTNDQARVRIEWPVSNIMHNKFLVMENADGKKSVWSGTANLSKNCMGIERNANMSIYIKNDAISQAFQDEFDQMYGFDSSVKSRSKSVVPLDSNQGLPIGRFHRNKLPISRRLFSFEDGTKVRVHFAPTGDAEHRVILPMLLSAKQGDIIRISMFGGTGYEIVRAMQYAAAQGAEVRIAFDRKLGAGLSSWIRDPILNVFMKNPYTRKVKRAGKMGKILVRTSAWEGKNHYKVGSLTRKMPDGSMFAEQIIIGSQNWSSGGNDSNDENLIAIQNLEKEVDVAKIYNEEFDKRLWPLSNPKTRATPIVMNSVAQ